MRTRSLAAETPIFTGVLPEREEDWTLPVPRRLPMRTFELEAAAAAPAYVNWDDQNMIPDPGTQLPLNACVSYAACIAAAARYRKRTGESLTLAPRATHLCSLGLEAKQGTNSYDFVEAVKASGLPFATSPSVAFASSTMTQKSQCGSVGLFKALPVLGAEQIANPADLKRELFSDGPVVAHISLYRDFWEAYQPGSIYEPGSAAPVGEHAVCLIGYDDNHQCWIGVNSLGTGWGARGRFRLRYGACDLFAKYKPVYALMV